MRKLMISTRIEGKKLFHSKIPLLTFLVLMLIPFIGGFFMYILKDPTTAESLGFISAKAQLMGNADWMSYFSLIGQAITIGGLIAFGFITSWIFGREYSDRTITDLLSLPISRTTIVLSKFLITFFWSFLLSVFVFIISLVVGYFVNIPGMTMGLLLEGTKIYFIASSLTILLSTPVGLAASYGRGYLSPLGFIVITLIFAQIIVATGYGEYFPWSIPTIISVSIEETKLIIQKLSLFLVLLTSGIGLIGTVFWWNYADND